MSENNKNTEHTKSVFDDDFEVIYEGELPDFPPEPVNDGYKDVLAQLADLDDESTHIDYLEENRTRPINLSDTAKLLCAKKHRIPKILSSFSKNFFGKNRK